MNKKHGEGIYRYCNGSVYNGNFKDDMYDEYGVMKYVNGSQYKG